MFGDVKTVDNIDKITEVLSHRPLSLKESNDQANVFSKALSTVMTLPGDWHGSLTMVQSILNIFWDGFLEPIKHALKWKRITKDARGCYFQASCLVMFVYHEITSLFMHTFVSEKIPQLKKDFKEQDTDCSDSNFICFVAKSFVCQIDKLHTESDNWLKTCSVFISMAKDFFTFIDSFRSGDAIGIENGYQQFVPVWRALGQNRNVERHWRQIEMLLQNVPYSRLQESREN